MLPRHQHGRTCLAAAMIATVASAASAQFNAIPANDTVSMGFQVVDAQGRSAYTTTQNSVNVPRGILTDIGQNNYGSGRVQVLWNDTPQTTNNLLTVIFRTSNGEDLAPSSANVPGGGAAAYWTWQFGLINPVNFLSGFSSSVTSASITYLFAGGNQTSETLPLSGSWNGSIPGKLYNSVGQGVSLVQLSIYHQPIPAPGSAALLGTAALVATRRRRR